MRIAKYELKPDGRFQSGAQVDNADEIGRHIELLREQSKGELTPQDVITDAKNHNSPLHSFFEWDDGEAAEQYRLQQARGLIRAVVAVYVDETEPARRIQAFVHIPEAGTPHYRSVEQAMSQERTRDMVLRQAWKEFQSWKKRYAHLDELADFFKSVDRAAKKLPDLG